MFQSSSSTDFRETLNKWESFIFWEDASDRIKTLLDGGQMILFFNKAGDVFGAPEESRIIFAKMKSPDQDTTKDWMDEASFMAYDLFKALTGQRVQNVFGKKDMKDIKVIDRDECEKMLNSKLKKEDDKPGNLLRKIFASTAIVPVGSPEQPLGLTSIKDKK